MASYFLKAKLAHNTARQTAGFEAPTSDRAVEV